MISLTALVVLSQTGQLTIATAGGISAIRNRFFRAVADNLLDDYDRQTIQPDSIERAGQGHILFPAGRANRMFFFEHIDLPSFGESGWPRFRIKAFELRNGAIHRLGVWSFNEGQTKLNNSDGTLIRFIKLDQPKCQLPANRIPEIQSFFSDKSPWACYQIQKMNGTLASFISEDGTELDEFSDGTNFAMTNRERRYLKRRPR